MSASLVGSEMCIRDRHGPPKWSPKLPMGAVRAISCAGSNPPSIIGIEGVRTGEVSRKSQALIRN
eukprot:13312639-Alexandrium_andersonii.AAC.1